MCILCVGEGGLEIVQLMFIFLSSFLFFLSICRNEIASCEEAAYDSLPLKDAATLLFFTSQSELMNFAQQVKVQPFYSEDSREY